MDVRGISGPKTYSLGCFFVPDNTPAQNSAIAFSDALLRSIAVASDFRVDGAKSPEIPQKEGVLGTEIAARNRRSLATFHCTL